MFVQQLTDGEQVLDMRGKAAGQQEAFVALSTDPNIIPSPATTPGDFAAQFPTPLDTTEIIAMCEEVNLIKNLPEDFTGLKEHTWRELNALAFTSGSAYISFADGECPEVYSHSGDNTTITLKNIGAKKTLTVSDILHSAAVSSANWNGINRLLGPQIATTGLPGGDSTATAFLEGVADVKEKEIILGMTLVMNGWDALLVNGNSSSNSLEFDGIETTLDGTGAEHTNDASASGTFSAQSFDRWLAEGCAKPTLLAGHPQAIQEVMSAYFQLGFQGSEVVNITDANRITPGYNFAGFLNSGVGTLRVVADTNFATTDMGNGAFTASVYALRMTHNGVPLVYRLTQIPLALKDLAPGCTAISFQIWAKTSLVIKHACAHGVYASYFSGRIVTTCPTIG